MRHRSGLIVRRLLFIPVALFIVITLAFGLINLTPGDPALVIAGDLATEERVDPARQVGTSGNIVSPRVYLAFGISGATQHVAGILGSRTIIAINKDSEAPIFGFAQFGVVDDALKVASELSKLYTESA